MSAEPVLSARAKPSPGGLDEAPNYTASLKHNVKVLDFIKSGGPKWTVDRTIFEMWLGTLWPLHHITGT